MSKDKLRFRILVFIFVVLFVRMILVNCFTEFVYSSPKVNTKVLPYISKTIIKLNEGLDYSVKSTNSVGGNVKILYKNAYGSGFLNHNPIPNDLDYAVGVNLGKYSYNGQNAKEIAKDMEDKMSSFEISFYDYINNNNDNLYSNFNLMSSIISFEDTKASRIDSMAYGLNKIFDNKDYILHTVKNIEDKGSLKYPFILKSNEILVENYPPMQLFTPDLSYNKNMSKYLREITIVMDYFADVEDTRTKQAKRVEIVSESFVGQRFQLSRRFFVPTVFTGESSASYIKTLDFYKEDKEYIDHRLLNFRRLLQELSNLNQANEQPVKMLKRVLQCTELMDPVLDKKLEENIYKTVSKNLQSKDLQATNDYSTALGNLIQVSALPTLYSQVDRQGYIKQLLDSMQSNLECLAKSNEVNKQDVKALLGFQKFIGQEYSKINSKETLGKFNKRVLEEMEVYNPKVLNIYSKTIKNKAELASYVKVFNDIFINAGFHKINLYWLDEDTLGIVKDDFTDIKPSEIKKMVIENDLPDVKYKLITKNQAPQITVRYSVWVRYNPTKQEDKNWQTLQNRLLADKKNFRVKRRFIPKF